MANTSNPVGTYFDHLIDSYDIVGGAVIRAGERSARLSKNFLSTVVEGQRAALETSQQMATAPADIGHAFDVVSAAIEEGRGRFAKYGEVLQKELFASHDDFQESFSQWQAATLAAMQSGAEAVQGMVADTPIGDGLSQLGEILGSGFGQPATSQA
jgi:hypothetical protein